MPHDDLTPNPGGLTVNLSPEGDDIVVALAGELDLATVGELERAIREAESLDGQVVIDLRELAFMDSTGLRAILLAHERLGEADRSLAIRRGPDAVQRVFELTGLTDRLNFVD